ncbi:hypothetical protein, partial [Pseudomonas sp. S31]|uniref:hypothetical protein n=1 Tax=Pseudomonas sp. S31 TaxID=1564473 RepID=UPI001F37201F
PPFHGGNRGSSPLGDASFYPRFAGLQRLIRLLNGPFVFSAFRIFSSDVLAAGRRRETALAKKYYENNISIIIF